MADAEGMIPNHWKTKKLFYAMSWDFLCLKIEKRPGEQKNKNSASRWHPVMRKRMLFYVKGRFFCLGERTKGNFSCLTQRGVMLSPHNRRRKEQSHFTTGQDIQTSPHCMSRWKVLKMERKRIGITRRNRWRTLNLASHSATNGECPHLIFLPIFFEKIFEHKGK
jgi:hypothetical protein